MKDLPGRGRRSFFLVCMRILDERGAVIAEEVEVARGFAARLIGLIGRRSLPSGFALVIPGCRQVHTFFMRFPIDVLFLDADNRVICLESDIKPYRATGYCRGAACAVELPAGTASEHGLGVGDSVVMSEE